MTDYKNMRVRDETKQTFINNIKDGLITGLGVFGFVLVFFLAQSAVWG